MPDTFPATLFWLLLALVTYVYAGYPLLLWCVRALRGGRPVGAGHSTPRVTLMISAFNEENVIARKLENTYFLDYPADRLQVIVISDASTDRTDDIVGEFSTRNVELLRMPQQGGKTQGLNEAMRRADGEIVVFSDANAMYECEALRALVRNFADPSVGAVIGESGYGSPATDSARDEGLYWRYETVIKRLESQIGSVVGGDGAIYAIRRELYRPMRADALSDFVNPLQIVQGGHRCVYEPAARSFEDAADSYDKEFRRKVRIVNRAWRALFAMRGLLNPLRHGLFSLMLISHKLMRWLVPVYLLSILAANLLLLDAGVVYRLLFATQLAFYGLALAGFLLRHRRGLPSLLSVPYYFCLVNLASLRGVIDAFRGRTYTTWKTARAAGQ